MSTKGSVQPDGTPCRGEEVILQRNFLATLQELRDSDRPALVPVARKEDIICCNCHQVSINQYANEQSEEIMRFYSADE